MSRGHQGKPHKSDDACPAARPSLLTRFLPCCTSLWADAVTQPPAVWQRVAAKRMEKTLLAK